MSRFLTAGNSTRDTMRACRKITDEKHRNSARVIGALICPYHNIEVKSDVDWAQENNYIHKNSSISCARMKCEEQHGAVK